MLNLIRETGAVPTAESVAQKANLSLRTVFRHFENKRAKIQAVNDFLTEELFHRFPTPPPGESPDVELLVDQRARRYEHAMPIRKFVECKKHEEPMIREELIRYMERDRLHLARYFEKQLPRDHIESVECLDVIQTITSWNNWVLLRDDLGYSVEKSKKLVVRSLKAFLISMGGDENSMCEAHVL